MTVKQINKTNPESQNFSISHFKRDLSSNPANVVATQELSKELKSSLIVLTTIF